MDLCLEIEGLIALVDQRGNKVPDRLHELLHEKVSILLGGVDALSHDVVPCSHSVQEDVVLPEATIESDPEALVEEIADNTVEDKSIEIAPSAAHCVEQVRNDVLKTPEFSLNDKFRFRRELFGNSDVDMAEALQVAESMSSVEEVEDYFYNDLCWDSNKEEVVDFLRVITARFNH